MESKESNSNDKISALPCKIKAPADFPKVFIKNCHFIVTKLRTKVEFEKPLLLAIERIL